MGIGRNFENKTMVQLRSDLLIQQKEKGFLEEATNCAKTLWVGGHRVPITDPEAWRNCGMVQDKAVEARQELRPLLKVSVFIL